MRPQAPRALRCAIYTRVSTEHGLGQEFNSLDNQREASEAYVKSQAHEGWRALPARYDDGGFSGGSMDRPALQRLLADIRARLIDVVVVYKVDRLTRSLADFAKLVELFDEHGVSFVSVTQAFNTTSSMGRLTLNVLLSFAQFEREVTGERIRDKIAASKRKGIWMGGHVPLGYRVQARKLVVDEHEAERVRYIFRRYVELKSLMLLLQDLLERGITTKERRLSAGSTRGGITFTRGPLAYLLKNRTYLGEIVHKGERHMGEHQAIIDRELFEAVQRQLASQAQDRRPVADSVSWLTGRIYDDRGNRMTPTHANKGGVRYRYYVSHAVLQGRKQEAGSVARVPAPDIEAIVRERLVELRQDSGAHESAAGPEVEIESLLQKIEVRRRDLTIIPESGSPITVPWSLAPQVRKREVIVPANHDQPERTGARPIRAEARARLLESIAKARLWLDGLTSGRFTSTREIAAAERCSERSVRMTLALAFLPPETVKAAVEGRLPHVVTLSTLCEVPISWPAQRSRADC
jgi:site-specific DNA recombinase